MPNKNKQPTERFAIVSWNAAHSNQHKHRIRQYLYDNRPTIMTIQEAQGYSDITHPHYLVYQSQNKYLLILVQTSFPHKYIQQQMSHNNSAMGTIVGSNITIHMVYQHPKSNKAQSQEMWDTITKIHYNNSNIIAIGDFNASHSSWSPQGNENLLGQWLFNNIQKVKWITTNNTFCPYTSTYICKSKNTLDLAIASSLDLVSDMQVLQQSVLVSDHFPIQITINNQGRTYGTGTKLGWRIPEPTSDIRLQKPNRKENT